jgi:hypothetical protein
MPGADVDEGEGLMAEFDHGMKKIAQTTGRQLARLAGVECQHWGPIESTLQVTTELLSDRAFLAQQDSERFIGRANMNESKFYREVIEEGEMKASRENILALLGARFKGVSLADIEVVIEALEDLPQLKRLVLEAGMCGTLDAFRAALPAQPATA